MWRTRTTNSRRLFLQITCLWQISFIVQTIGDECFCLKRKLTNLRNPIHIEPTVIENKKVYFLAEQRGIIYKYDPQASGGQRLVPYIDIADKVVCTNTMMEERGLLGFALHPEFPRSERVFMFSIRRLLGQEYAVVSEIEEQEKEKERILLLIEQPGVGENGGQLLFGADGYLYVFVGNGQPATRALSRAQDGTSFLGKVLRLDISKHVVKDNRLQYYVVPADNPTRPGWKPEIYAVGARNMWRCSLDPGAPDGSGKGRIFCGDLGADITDEIVLLQKGGNYGWPFKQGSHCVGTDEQCSALENEVLPVKEFSAKSDEMTAVIGGPVYRGHSFPNMQGQLLYGDFQGGDLFRLQENGSTLSSHSLPRCHDAMCPCDSRQRRSSMLLSFGQTHEREVLLLLTEIPNPFQARGEILLLEPADRSGHVTCGTNQLSGCLHSLIVMAVLYRLLLM